MFKRTFIIFASCLPLLADRLAAQTTRPDETLDWLLTQPVPATAPTTQPASSPLVGEDKQDALTATVTMSDGTILTGSITTTAGKPIRIWDEAAAEYRDVPLKLIASFAAEVVWQRQQPEWKFVESGSDIKEMTGRSYPARELIYTTTLVNGQHIRGGIVAPLYFEHPQQRRTLVLNKRQKGEIGQSLDQLVFVSRVEIGR